MRRDIADDHRGIAALYAVQSHQRALEIELPRDVPDPRLTQGVFTFTLCRVLAELARDGRDPALREIEERVLEAYEKQPFAHLQPIFDGGDLDSTFIGGAMPRPRPLVLKVTDSGLRVDGGVLEGVEEGARLACELPGFGSRRLEVVRCRGLDAECRFVSAEPGLLEAVPATGVEVTVVQRALDTRLGLFVAHPGGAEKLRELIASYPSRWREVTTAEAADWVVRESGEAFRFEAIGSRGSRAFDVGEADLGDALRRIGRFEATLRVAGRWAGRLPGGVVVKTVRIKPSGEEESVGPRNPLRPGDRIQIYVANGSKGAVDLNVLLFGADCGIRSIWPRRGETSILTPEEKSLIPLWASPPRIDDVSFDIEHLLVVAAPTEGMTTRLGHRLAALRQPGFDRSRSEEDPVAEFLLGVINEDATRGTRDAMPSFGMKVIAIRTAWSRFLVPDAPKVLVPLEDAAPPRITVELPDHADLAAPGALVGWLRPDDTTAPDIVVTGDVTATGAWKPGTRWTALVDVDRDSDFADPSLPKPGDLAAFDFEIVLVIEPDGRRFAGYDRHGSGRIDLVLVNDDADPEADVRFERSRGAWRRSEVDDPWLWTQYIELLRVGVKDEEYKQRRALRRRTTERIRALFP